MLNFAVMLLRGLNLQHDGKGYLVWLYAVFSVLAKVFDKYLIVILYRWWHLAAKNLHLLLIEPLDKKNLLVISDIMIFIAYAITIWFEFLI